MTNSLYPSGIGRPAANATAYTLISQLLEEDADLSVDKYFI